MGYEYFKDKGNAEFKSQNYNEALSYYSKAISEKGDEAIAYSNRAMCLIKLERFYEAKDDCDMAIRMDTTLTKAYYRRATAWRELLHYQKALLDFQKVLTLDPSFGLVQKDIKILQDTLKEDKRVDLKLFDKPPQYRSNTSMKTVEIKNQFSRS